MPTALGGKAPRAAEACAGHKGREGSLWKMAECATLAFLFPTNGTKATENRLENKWTGIRTKKQQT